MKKYFPILLILVITNMPLISMAQPGFGDDTDDVPIDGGISLLVAAGVGYGAKKLRSRNNKNKNHA